ncbi:thiamine pyrophosphokinase [Trema orientale]|uniref:thiamine diphosphokinase n=1 Tax=Trema orientale TaxID=63057 RepID=A0A2P5FFK9_TREOI|nr:thiamine pyrophosphokinase [Trema orientale]
MEFMTHSSTFLLPTVPDGHCPSLTYALVLLNQRLPRFAPLLWEHDGGANRLYDEFPLFFPHEHASDVRNRYKPDVIKGDMDSIRTEVLDFYTSMLCILVAGALGGRFDHEMGNINVLCRFSTIRIVLLSEDCLVHLLPKTHQHEIRIQSSVEGPHCGLIPIGMSSGKTTTSGLEWDLNETEMRFGGLVSTSNLVKEEKISVRSVSDILWTISIKKL